MKSYLGNFYRHLAIFIWSHCEGPSLHRKLQLLLIHWFFGHRFFGRDFSALTFLYLSVVWLISFIGKLTYLRPPSTVFWHFQPMAEKNMVENSLYPIFSLHLAGVSTILGNIILYNNWDFYYAFLMGHRWPLFCLLLPFQTNKYHRTCIDRIGDWPNGFLSTFTEIISVLLSGRQDPWTILVNRHFHGGLTAVELTEWSTGLLTKKSSQHGSQNPKTAVSE